MRTISKLCENLLLDQLGEIDVENPLGNRHVRRGMAPSKYESRAKNIIEKLNDGDSILEIGCGYGGLAIEIFKKVQISYTVVDIPEMLNQTKDFLKDKAEYIIPDDIEMLEDRKFTMFISHFCLSETPPEYREYILKNIIKNCQKVSVYDFEDSFKPTPKLLKLGFEMSPEIIEHYLNKYFIITKVVDPQREGIYPRFQFTGRRRK